MGRWTLRALRAHAVGRSLRPAASLPEAIAAMRFVQIDPIRAPARAADLILRQRVAGYRAGDLDAAYAGLGIAEGHLHVYGVMPEATRALLHPRVGAYRFRVEREHPRLASRVLAHVAENGDTHPRDLGSIGRARTVNGWGSQSAATTRILEALHFRGRLRVARRENGIKVYALAPPPASPPAAASRARSILLLLLDIYAPLPEASFRELARMVADSSLPSLRGRAFEALLAEPALERIAIEGVRWLLPAREAPVEPDRRVRFLAPFDPVVWDRRRFEALWGWEYRLEAYTPPPRRKFGYYALPLLWGDGAIGWVNAKAANGTLAIAIDYVRAAPRGAAFRRELAAEAETLRACLGAARVELR
ncbi:MAG TPA: crosslink repair DNA glycosylase YcaQ family protein [Casimicrobiaceae bacterium]|nr:crosslink repair DNA glycosylase YcaQ family protein [Casimicrobiaceae bacterium]